MAPNAPAFPPTLRAKFEILLNFVASMAFLAFLTDSIFLSLLPILKTAPPGIPYSTKISKASPTKVSGSAILFASIDSVRSLLRLVSFPLKPAPRSMPAVTRSPIAHSKFCAPL